VTSDELRRAFLDFFMARGHQYVRSAPLVPHDDPTLLFTSAGMVQFKPYFMGYEQPPAPRLTSIQRCFRTTDIEEVGDPTHQTFFEMLGNFSVGDYFKGDAIAWAWEFLTGVLALPAERLWSTVYLDDDEAYDLWVAQGQSPERIVRYGEDENYWFVGDVGPCGPCSEVNYDFGPETGCGLPDCQPAHSCGRFLEIWNLVFTTYNLHEDGTRTPLPAPNIDTGSGLERLSSVLQHQGPGIASNYETDLFRPLIEAAARLTGRRYGEDEQVDLPFRIIADHARAVTFLIADGVLPSNEGRGYVLRRILRRAVYFARRSQMGEAAFVRIVEAVIARMSNVYPYLRENQESITAIAGQEERRFNETLERGMQRLDAVLADLPASLTTFPGEEAFRLYDTYGVPKELTDEIAAMRGLSPDDAGFQDAMERQRERARAQSTFRASLAGMDVISTPFVGYEQLTASSRIVQLGQESNPVARLEAGDRGWIALGETPFYPEGGGQVGDAGLIRTASGTFSVEDTRRAVGSMIGHYGVVREGWVALGQQAEASVDPLRRQDTMRNHTGTHLLHAALRDALGPHAHQAGSLVAPDRLRFDFTHSQATSPEQLLAVERLVNHIARNDTAVETQTSTYEAATAAGALAFFGEKYGNEVRVVRIGGDADTTFSAELCGGTHVRHTGQMGLLRVVSEGGIGSGVRRIEALTGAAAERWVQEQGALVERIAAQIGATAATLESRVAGLVADLEAERRALAALQRERGREQAERIAAEAERRNGSAMVVASVSANSVQELREIGDLLRGRLGSVAVVLGSVIDARPQFVAQVTPDLVHKGLNAGRLIGQIAAVTGGKGGGRPESAQGGGAEAGKLSEALALARRLLGDQFGEP
jgi:alanyl-tRNA synthetase